MLYHDILYHAMLYHDMLYHDILHHDMLYHLLQEAAMSQISESPPFKNPIQPQLQLWALLYC